MATDEDEPRASTESDRGGSGSSGSSSSSGNSGSSSDSDSDDNGSDDEQAQVEWLATSRARRSNAGNRMKSMLAREEPDAADDSDLDLLFAEDDDDAGFMDVEQGDGSDVQMDSSSDDEDHDEGGDELDGEKELENLAREKRRLANKRKAQNAIPAKFRKKVRIDQRPTRTSASPALSTAPSVTTSRPRKKSDRTSWLPTPADMPTRASQRQTTKLSKAQLHEKMRIDDLRRQKQAEQAEKKAKKLEALKKPPMTQAERLAEAASVEKRNSKSLNRWEEAEKQREEERLKKIAALNSRRLEGPFVRFWSGVLELDEAQQKRIGLMVSMEEKPRKKRQTAAEKAAEKVEAAKAAASPSTIAPTAELPTGGAMPLAAMTAGVLPLTRVSGPVFAPIDDSAMSHATTHSAGPTTPAAGATVAIESSTPPLAGPLYSTASFAAPEASSYDQSTPSVDHSQISSEQSRPAMLSATLSAVASATTQDKPNASSGVLAAPILAPPFENAPSDPGSQMPTSGLSAPAMRSNVLALPDVSQSTSSLSLQIETAKFSAPCGPDMQLTGKSSSAQAPQPAQANIPEKTSNSLHDVDGHNVDGSPEPGIGQSREGRVSRHYILLQNFDEDAIKDKHAQTRILFGRKMMKLTKPAPTALCAITNYPAQYRDPQTGLPFANSYAYKEIRRLLRHEYKFSNILGTWVGTGSTAAHNTPGKFLDPSQPRSTPHTKQAETKGKGKEDAPDQKEVNHPLQNVGSSQDQGLNALPGLQDMEPGMDSIGTPKHMGAGSAPPRPSMGGQQEGHTAATLVSTTGPVAPVAPML